MSWLRAALAVVVAVAAAALFVSGGSRSDPHTPRGPTGMPAPLFGVALVGDGGLTAAVDAYGDVVDLRRGPAGKAIVAVSPQRQRAGTVGPESALVPRARIGGRWLPLWRADTVRQHYLPGTNVLVTEARFGPATVRLVYAARGGGLACLAAGEAVRATPPLRCDDRAARRQIALAARDDRAWLARARPLGRGAPGWAVGLYRRSLLTLRALTNTRTGASAAGAREGWAYVWPRDAATAALAFAAAGYRGEARRIARFLAALDLDAAARFHGDGSPVSGRAAQGDAAGWAAVATHAAGLPRSDQRPAGDSASTAAWRNRADYWEGAPGDFLANALSAHADVSDLRPHIGGAKSETSQGGGDGAEFATARGLVRRAGDAASGLDSAAAWAVRPFPRPELFPAVRRTLAGLMAEATPYGITPGSGWHGGGDPWAAPTAWAAWAFAALARERGSPDPAADRRQALDLLARLRRSATPAGLLPERVDASSGAAASTTPLAWPHAFAALTLQELWPTNRSTQLEP